MPASLKLKSPLNWCCTLLYLQQLDVLEEKRTFVQRMAHAHLKSIALATTSNIGI